MNTIKLNTLTASQLWSLERAASRLRITYTKRHTTLTEMATELTKPTALARVQFARNIGLTVAYSNTDGHSHDLENDAVCELLAACITNRRQQTIDLLVELRAAAAKLGTKKGWDERMHRVRFLNVKGRCEELGLDFTNEEILSHTHDSQPLDGKISSVIARMTATREAAAAEQTANELRRDGLTETAEQFDRLAEKKRTAAATLGNVVKAVVFTLATLVGAFHAQPVAAAQPAGVVDFSQAPAAVCETSVANDRCQLLAKVMLRSAARVATLAAVCEDEHERGVALTDAQISECITAVNATNKLLSNH